MMAGVIAISFGSMKFPEVIILRSTKSIVIYLTFIFLVDTFNLKSKIYNIMYVLHNFLQYSDKSNNWIRFFRKR